MQIFKKNDIVTHNSLGKGIFIQYSNKSKNNAIVKFGKTVLNVLVSSLTKSTLSELEIVQNKWDAYNKNLDMMIELGSKLIKSYGREI
jgi:hypothetical protein